MCNFTRDRNWASGEFVQNTPVPTGYEIVGAVRNENAALWRIYQVSKEVIRLDCMKPLKEAPFKKWTPLTMEAGKGLDWSDMDYCDDANEWLLFHASIPEALSAIARTGFTMAKLGSGGTTGGGGLYGDGTYFGDSITKADEYARRKDAGCSHPDCCVKDKGPEGTREVKAQILHFDSPSFLDWQAKFALRASADMTKLDEEEMQSVPVALLSGMEVEAEFERLLAEADGVNLGLLVGLLEGSLIITTGFAYAHLLALLVVNLRQASGYERLLDEKDPEEVDYKVNVGLGGSAVLAMLILQIISGIVVWQFSYHRLLIVSTVFGILAAAFGLAKIFPKLVNGVGPCPCCSCFFCSVIVYIMTAMLVVVAGSLPDDPNFLLEKSSFSPAPNASHFDVNHQAPGVLAGFGAYPICNNMQWDSLKPTKGSQLTALDLLVFAQAVYFGPRKDIQEELDNATLNTELYPVTIDSIQDTGEVGRVGVFSMSNVKTRVIAIRGSSQAPDWTFNLDVWGPGVFHSFVKTAFPFGSLVPTTFAKRRLSVDVRELLGLDPPWVRIGKQIQAAKELSEKDDTPFTCCILQPFFMKPSSEKLEGSRNPRQDHEVTGKEGCSASAHTGISGPVILDLLPVSLSAHLASCVDMFFRCQDGYNLILTGHSLGGGLAQVLGSLERIPTLVWMPVGGAFTAYRTFGFEVNELPLENNIVAVVPWGDLVPVLLESLDATTQHVGCTTSPGACHSLSPLLCELYRKCGDPRGRNVQKTCKKFIGPDWRDIPWKRFIWHTFF
ncbi:unnamed protein product [Durusdinium trenchii]|uniref:Fungal lipase-like domain-containing protein n=1 Tax=Durusdinium trenchii TaxID=1381693 RepID=A0ABP0L991_9DINO